jgi:hypothetical protein
MASNALTDRVPGWMRSYSWSEEPARAGWLSLFPLLLSIPFLYWPRVIESDTQPWVVGGAAIALLTYWPRRADFSKAFPVVMTTLGILAVGAYWLKQPDNDMLLRYAVIVGTFVMLWHVGSRGVHRSVGTMVRFTIVLWFAVGFYQTIALRLGLPVDFFGRYVSGRSGVPSLTVEASYYGSISVLQLMYLFTDRRQHDWVYQGLAAVSVILSGSLLSLLLLIFPFFRLPLTVKLVAGFAAVIVLMLGVDVLELGFFARLQVFDPRALLDSLLSDYSTNLRTGHIVYTCYAALPRELLFLNGPDFYYEFNQWAFTSRVFVPNDSGFILPAGGELLFRSGSVGLLLLLVIFLTAWRSGTTRFERIEKLLFVMACLVNPVSLSNPVFVLYIHKKYSESQ